ncbi:DUF2141 domain-containing protein [Aquimarina longa]|uniref:DUF2141 domain-containing protein n=1 Tax=Aquimarina longa TaxID=1080221 RepID=UPI00078257FA|nr:DUF2141 domain-containing protein [Aquimarina longa]
MKTLATLIALLISNFFLQAQKEDKGVPITVTVENIKSSEGEILFGLYDQNTFMKTAPIKSKSSKVINGTTQITFTDIPKGIYAISCFHDMNGNHKMDLESNGIPKERYGISNNIKSYGPPQWNDAKFEVEAENLNIKINLRN